MVFFLWLSSFAQSRPLYVLSTVLLALSCVDFRAVSRPASLVCLGYVGLCLLRPELAQLGGLAAAVLLLGGGYQAAAGVSVTCLLTSAWMPRPDWIQPSVIAVGLFCWAGVGLLRHEGSMRRCAAAAMVAAAAAGMASMALLPTVARTSPGSGGVEFGDVIERIVGKKMPPGASVCLEGEGPGSGSSAKTIVLEHDARMPDGLGASVLGNYSQPRPWSWNQPIGSEVLRYWVARDGAVVSNIGAMVSGGGNMVLGVPGRVGVVPVVLAGRATLVADSDPLLDFLAPYSQSTLCYLVSDVSHERVFGWVYHGLCMLLALLALRLGRPALAACCAGLLLAVVAQAELREALRPGDIRLAGVTKGWPHDAGVYGVPRAMNKEGYRFTVGSVGASVLCVGPGAHAALRGEKLAILSPEASVTCPDGSVFLAEEVPMGDANGIPDARRILLRRDGVLKDVAVGVITVNGITMLATGSAGRLTGWGRHIECPRR